MVDWSMTRQRVADLLLTRRALDRGSGQTVRIPREIVDFLIELAVNAPRGLIRRMGLWFLQPPQAYGEVAQGFAYDPWR